VQPGAVPTVHGPRPAAAVRPAWRHRPGRSAGQPRHRRARRNLARPRTAALTMPEALPAPDDPRVRLAAERTLLAWVRTGLSLMGFGFVVARFGLFLHELAAARGQAIQNRGGSLWIGIGLVALGVIVLLVSAGRYREYSAALP